MPLALAWLSPAGLVAYLVGLLLFAGAGVLLGRMLHYALHDGRAPLGLALPVGWTALEWGLAHLPGTLAYPWLGLGTTLTGVPEMAGLAELVGARGVGFWVAAVNGVVASAVRVGTSPASDSESHRAATVLLLAAGALVGGPSAWGFWRADTLPERPALRVALVQTNVAQSVRLDPERAVDTVLVQLGRLAERVPPGSVDLVVLPEAVLPTDPRDARSATGVERLRVLAERTGSAVLFGARGRTEEGGPLNSVFLLDAGGLSGFRYDKRRLVPLVERSPLLPVPFAEGLRPGEELEPGVGLPLADVGGSRLGAFVCFESAFPDVARGLRAAGASVLVNVTNDAWFGLRPAHARTPALWQHPAHLVMRAIETRTPVVRAGNAGFSFFVDPRGRVRERTALFTEDVRTAELRTTDVRTAYVRYGDLVGNAAGVSGLLLLLAAFRSGRVDRVRAL